LAGVAWAHEHATGVAADRMAAMKTMETELKAIRAMLSGEEPYDLGKLRAYATTLHDNCHRSESLFPAGSHDHHSRAREAVWDSPDEFRMEFHRLHASSEALVATVADGDRADIAVATADLQKACDGCHAVFRKPD
jgi:cytochrome c556